MIPSSWAHNSRIERFRGTHCYYNDASNRSYHLQYRDDHPFHHYYCYRNSGDFFRPRSPFVMRDSYFLDNNMGSPSALDSRIAEEKSTETSSNTTNKPQNGGVTYETTAEGDVAIVQPAFDDHDGRSPGGERKSSAECDTRSPPSKDRPHRGHTRNLSEHFQDATTLTGEVGAANAGQKHRRGYSGDVSNPAQAHRRINSIGNSASVKRGGTRDHRRIDSSGLDALTAAADFSREELAAAAGNRPLSWDPSGIRRSPIELTSYDHSKAPPQQQPPLAHHRHYTSGGPPSVAYYGPPPTYQAPYHPPPPTYYQGHVYGHPHAPPPTSRYPVQYARSEDPYSKQQAPLQQPVLERLRTDDPAHYPSPSVTSIDHSSAPVDRSGVAIPSDEGMNPPAPPRIRGGSTQGVQTYVTAISVGDTTRTLDVNPQIVPTAPAATEGAASAAGHHRKLSSFSNLGPFLFGVPGEATEHPLKKGSSHHRVTSSTVSFLQTLDVGLDMNNPDATFLRNLQATTGAPAAFNPMQTESAPISGEGANLSSSDGEKTDSSSKLAAGGTSKRVRRKCTIEGCHNRVVQGGLCIAHGAKRKQCKHPGCTKHVKKAGLCSTHGPARKRCEAAGCTKVAVQGGRCIAHGAKKKLCSVDNCSKQAILSGMCKKHHDQSQQNSTGPPDGVDASVCQIIDAKKPAHSHSPKQSSASAATKKPTHTRGLSIFQEISVDAVGDLLSGDEASQPAAGASSQPAPPPSHRHRSTFSREFASMY